MDPTWAGQESWPWWRGLRGTSPEAASRQSELVLPLICSPVKWHGHKVDVLCSLPSCHLWQSKELALHPYQLQHLGEQGLKFAWATEQSWP